MWTNTGPVKFLLKGSHGVAVVSYNVQEPTKDLPGDAVLLPTWLRTSRVFLEEALNELYLYSSCLFYTQISTQISKLNVRGRGNLLDLSQSRDLQVIVDVTYWAYHNHHGLLAGANLDQMRVNLIPNRIQNLELWLFPTPEYHEGRVAEVRVLPFLNLYSRFFKDHCSELKSLTISIQYDRRYVDPQSLISTARCVVGQRFTEQSCQVNSLAPPNHSKLRKLCLKFEPKEG